MTMTFDRLVKMIQQQVAWPRLLIYVEFGSYSLIYCRIIMWINMQTHIQTKQRHWVTLDHPEHYAEFQKMLDFHSGFNPKNKPTLELSIIHSLMPIIASDAGFHTRHQRPNFSIKLIGTIQNHDEFSQCI